MVKKIKKQQRNILVGMAGLLLLFFFFQSFSLVDLGNQKIAQFDTGRLPDSGRDSSVKQFSFKFDDYELKVQATDLIREFSGCDTTQNWNNFCNLREISPLTVEGKTCKRWEAGSIQNSCPSGYHMSGVGLCVRFFGKRTSKIAPTSSCTGARQTAGPEFNNKVNKCFWKGDIFYKGQLVDSIKGSYVKGWTTGIEGFKLPLNGGVFDNTTSIYYDLGFGSSTSHQQGSSFLCDSIEGNVKLKIQPKLLNFSFSSNEVVNKDGTDFVTITLQNDAVPFTGKLFVDFIAKTGFGSNTITVEKNITMVTGSNTYEVQFPAGLNVDTLEIIPRIELFYDVSGWSGVAQNTSKIGSLTGTTMKVSVLSSDEIALRKQVADLQVLTNQQQETLKSLQAQPIASGEVAVGQVIAQNFTQEVATISTNNNSVINKTKQFLKEQVFIITLLSGILFIGFLIWRRNKK